MSTLAITIGICGAAVLLLKLRSGMRRHRHILNILYAAYTFQQLSDEEKNTVSTAALNILHRGGIGDENPFRGRNDLQRYSIYALAMDNLGIPPSGGKYAWSFISRPLIVPRSMEADIELFEKDHGISLNLKY